jgi:hypothetical protein
LLFHKIFGLRVNSDGTLVAGGSGSNNSFTGLVCRVVVVGGVMVVVVVVVVELVVVISQISSGFMSIKFTPIA